MAPVVFNLIEARDKFTVNVFELLLIFKEVKISYVLML